MQALLSVPSLATGSNLARLLQDGILGIALPDASSPEPGSSPSSQTVIYTWVSGSAPVSLLPQDGTGTGTGRALDITGPPYTCEYDWLPAIYSADSRRVDATVLPISPHRASGASRTTADDNADALQQQQQQQPPRGGLRLGVTAAALERLASSDPEDVQQRAWQEAAVAAAAGPHGGGGGGGGGFDLDWLYRAVKPSGAEPQWMADPPELRPRLRPYQRRAVAWMLRREQVVLEREQNDEDTTAAATGFNSGKGGAEQRGEAAQVQPPQGREAMDWDAAVAVAAARGPASADVQEGGDLRAAAPPLHPLWRRLRTLPGSAAEAVYVNPYTGALAAVPFPAPQPVRGGILADEMGLGKTVELLALITANRFGPKSQPGMAPLVAAGQALDPAAAAAAAAGGRAKNRKDWALFPGGGAIVKWLKCERDEPLLDSAVYGCRSMWGRRYNGGGVGGTVQPTSPAAAVAAARQRLPERVDCPCGVRADDPHDPDVEEYEGLWILCEGCNAWMHGACVGVKRSPQRSAAWVCSRCLRARALAPVSEPCGATLIVVPSAILQQWYDEIRRHVHPGALRVVVYGGQTQPGVSGSGALICSGTFTPGRVGGTAVTCGTAAAPGGLRGPADRGVDGDGNFSVVEADVAESMVGRWVVVSAAQLAAADVVLTTYDVLKRDVARQPDPEGQERSLRHGKRYEVVPTPLTRLRWWRVVLDEAQMVESSTAKAAEMALKLDTVHRWCVTGTPISRGLEDVYGLLAFLGVRPWTERRWWSRCVQRPAEACDPEGRRLLLHLLRPSRAVGDCAAGSGGGGGGGGDGGLMWRSAKRDVESELGLPPQSTHLRHLRLNAVELHFYNRRHQDCATKARAVLPPRVVAAMESGRLLGYGTEEQQDQQQDQMTEATAAEADVGEGDQPGRRVVEEQREAGRRPLAPGASEPATGSSQTQQQLHLQGQLGSQQGPEQGDHHPLCGAPPPVLTTPRGVDDPLRELHDIQRQRWELWRRRGAEEEAAAAAAAGEGGGGQGTTVNAGGVEEGGEEHGRGGGGGGGGVRAGSPPRLEGPRKALEAMASSLDRPLAPHEARKLLGPLLKLRQACCHPQAGAVCRGGLSVGAGGIRTLTVPGQPHHPHSHGGHHNGPMTMNDILAVLVTRAKLEAEEAQRQLIAAINGLSALLIIQNDVVEAIATYRTALRIMEDNRPDIDTDPLQRLHTLHNLAQMMAIAASASAPAALAAVPRTLRDHTLAEDAAAIRSRYLEQRTQRLVSQEAEYKELVSASSPFHGASGWYLAAIDLLVAAGHGPSAVALIGEKLLEGDTYRQKTEVNASSLALRLTSLLGLKVLLNDILDSLEEHRAAAMTALEDLGARTRLSQPPPELVELAGQCGRCRGGPVRALVCEHCRLDERFIQWQVRLFALYSRALTAGATVTAEEAARRAQTAMVLRMLLALLRQHFRRGGEAGKVEEIIREGKAHVERLEAQRRLLVAARAASLAQRMLLYAHDELAMATARMRLAREGEPIGPHEGNLKLHPAAVPVKSVELTNDRILAEGDLRRTLGTLSDALVAKTVPPSTPYHQMRVTCPTCRTRVHIADIAYIDAGLHREEAEGCVCGGGPGGGPGGGGEGPWGAEAAVVVRGSFGTKIEAVVRRVKFVLGQDAAAKVLVFSGWVDLLELVAAALAANAVPYVVARGRGGMTAALAAFKDHPGEADGVGDEGDEGEVPPGADQDQDQRTVAAGHHGKRALTAREDGADDDIYEANRSAEAARSGGEEKGEGESGEGAAATTSSLLPVLGGGCGGEEGQEQLGAAKSPSGALVAARPLSASTPVKQVVQGKPRVLLLQLKQGGAGLNLTEAQHVVLVEPQLDPAAEAQAVGRVHRIGQCRPTHVHRFVVVHTVEEQVYKLATARARGMDLSSAVPGGGGGVGGGHHHHGVRGGGAGGGDGSEHLTFLPGPPLQPAPPTARG
ncbi:hypothetical protein VOLCADRAFT_87560 [Volvox carteri f. nagariensis]|uniref:Uncharacterized protein n=1 Tax=Volvox carteri f. nagariensis TaxID=3068 RepID=D8TLM1_VOLCA|nr:uncharacterized protein VOLCADRAFT_87560 [Volvox carteri f. nagariensis]EFJ51898.1 hypothetical protein VOLCADRAFT_87560 [Volvox carteri f. nagariensis]|eukprot:XP_002947308.1 hypothetical protein VOLCADRAFT_87560 [Volvox carteri f. nagariensis]